MALAARQSRLRSNWTVSRTEYLCIAALWVNVRYRRDGTATRCRHPFDRSAVAGCRLPDVEDDLGVRYVTAAFRHPRSAVVRQLGFPGSSGSAANDGRHCRIEGIPEGRTSSHGTRRRRSR